MKQLKVQFKETNKQGLIKDITELYINKIMPLVSDIRNKKYVNPRVVKDHNTECMRLIEEPYDLTNLLIDLSEV